MMDKIINFYTKQCWICSKLHRFHYSDYLIGQRVLIKRVKCTLCWNNSRKFTERYGYDWKTDAMFKGNCDFLHEMYLYGWEWLTDGKCALDIASGNDESSISKLQDKVFFLLSCFIVLDLLVLNLFGLECWIYSHEWVTIVVNIR